VRVCDEPGCGRPHQARGICAMHYMRLHRAGALTELDRSSHKRLSRVEALVVRELAAGEIVSPRDLAARTGLRYHAVVRSVSRVRALFGAQIITTWHEGYELAAPLRGFQR